MTQQEIVNQLATLVEERLVPLIDHDYVLYGLPNYANVGDLLIWQGALELLKKVPYRCRGVCAWNEYPTESVAEDNIILVLGGGYFGDVWRSGWDYCLEGIRFYKNNKVIILPMSIHYNDEALRKADADYLAEFKRLVICARDDDSFHCAKTYFRNEVLLVPDLAWCIKKSYLKRWSRPSSLKVLLLKRNDKELGYEHIVIPDVEPDIHDWPTIETRTPAVTRFKKIIKLLNKCKRKLPGMAVFFQKIKDSLYYYYYRNEMNSQGIAFISSYEKVYATRLHGMILSVLLGKDVYIIDNSYGKLSACYSTWLKDVENIHLFKSEGIHVN